MLVEFIGGPKDGQQIEMPEGSQFVDLAMSIAEPHRWTQANGDSDPITVSYKTVRLYISTAADGKRFVIWREV